MSGKSLGTILSAVVLLGVSTQAPRGQEPGKGDELAKRKAAIAKTKGALPPLVGVTIERDVTYAKLAGDRELKLDLYIPEKAEGKLPLVVWVHGGGWRNGSKNGSPASRLAMFGYVAASIDYRLSDEAKFPAQIEDCKAAIRWLRANADKYHIDSARVGVWGGSAGGHLVALLGTAGDAKQWDVGENLDQASRVQAVCDFFGPADLTAMPGSQAANANGAVALLLGGPVAENREAARAASPVTYVSKNDPPFFICHGMNDPTVPIAQSEKLLEALQNAGVEAKLLKVKNAGHGFNSEDIDPTVPEIHGQVRAFFDEHLKLTDK